MAIDRKKEIQKAHLLYDNRDLLTELKYQREHLKPGYFGKLDLLFTLWLIDESIRRLKNE